MDNFKRQSLDVFHVPVLLDVFLRRIGVVSGQWLDATFGGGGYSRALLDAGARRVYGLDRDPEVFSLASAWAVDYADRLTLIKADFACLHSQLSRHGAVPIDGIIFDLGVSSLQLDSAKRGFSFMREGPLDMRMSKTGISAADIVNLASEATLADILYYYGEERAARRIARQIVIQRSKMSIKTTAQLAGIISGCFAKIKMRAIHPATRSFQALRIAVNDELGQLVSGLNAARRVLSVGGILAVISFHSLEDRIVKRFLRFYAAGNSATNRHQPHNDEAVAYFKPIERKVIVASPDEIKCNPRSRSARLRLVRRLAVSPGALKTDLSRFESGLPQFDLSRLI